MTDLNSTHAHFVRCIKPNLELKAMLYVSTLVLNQLRCSGTFDAVRSRYDLVTISCAASHPIPRC